MQISQGISYYSGAVFVTSNQIPVNRNRKCQAALKRCALKVNILSPVKALMLPQPCYLTIERIRQRCFHRMRHDPCGKNRADKTKGPADAIRCPSRPGRRVMGRHSPASILRAANTPSSLVPTPCRLVRSTASA